MNTARQSALKLFVSSILAVVLTAILAHSVSIASAPAHARTAQQIQVSFEHTLAG
jgi:hypothetical protein